MIKYCDQKHHFSNANKLQIGTLKYYQSHTDVKIADPQEGLTPNYTLRNDHEEMILSREQTEGLTFGGVKGGGITICPGGRININMQEQIPNQYIFCGTCEQSGLEETANSLGYNSWYQVLDVNGFMKAVAFSMARIVKPSNKLVWNYKIENFHAPVRYLRNIGLEHDNVKFDKFIDAVFCKPSLSTLDKNIDFRLNNEYRLLWRIYDETTRLIHDVDPEPILIDFTSEMKSFCK